MAIKLQSLTGCAFNGGIIYQATNLAVKHFAFHVQYHCHSVSESTLKPTLTSTSSVKIEAVNMQSRSTLP